MQTRMKLRSLRNAKEKKIKSYGLLPWIDVNRMDWVFVSSNPAAIHFLEQHLDDIDWRELSANLSLIHI